MSWHRCTDSSLRRITLDYFSITLPSISLHVHMYKQILHKNVYQMKYFSNYNFLSYYSECNPLRVVCSTQGKSTSDCGKCSAVLFLSTFPKAMLNVFFFHLYTYDGHRVPECVPGVFKWAFSKLRIYHFNKWIKQRYFILMPCKWCSARRVLQNETVTAKQSTTMSFLGVSMKSRRH